MEELGLDVIKYFRGMHEILKEFIKISSGSTLDVKKFGSISQ